MFRLLATISAIATVSACSSPQPFDWATENGTDETLETIDPTDPNVTVDSKFAYDRARGLTMYSVEYDSENDELIINNLPFDGPSGRYDRFGNVGAAGAYESRQTQYTGRVKHYAVFLRSEHIEAAAAAGADWVEFGYGGANITRDSFSAPIDGEYVYFGDYAGVRTFSDRSGLELVSGDVSILLDVNDFDPVDGIQGAIVGTIYNRSISGLVGSANASLQNVGLVLVEFTTDDGTFNGGGSVTSLANGTDGGSGSFDGFLAGPNSTDIGANIVMEGRDIGSVVFPDSRFKFYIDASEEVRDARRRKQGLRDQISERDRQDSSRKTAPLVKPENAHVIDSSSKTIDEVVDEILGILASRGLAPEK